VRYFTVFNDFPGKLVPIIRSVLSVFSTVLLLTLMGGCAVWPRVGDDASAIRARWGAPVLVMPIPAGERWFYPSGPGGLTTLAIDLDSSAKAASIRNVLNDGAVQSISAGQRADEVLATIGPPLAKQRFDNLRQTAWDYRYRDTWGYVVKLAVMIGDDGRVAAKVLERIEPTAER
jgi:hypothetical protein